MKPKKQSSLSRILGYAGGHKNLTLLGCILSVLSAVLGLIPYVCVWAAAGNMIKSWPDLDRAAGLDRWGWTAVWTAIGSIILYFAALMSTHIAAFRTARNIRRAAMSHVLKLPLGFFTGNQSGRLRKLIDDNAGLTEDLLAHNFQHLVIQSEQTSQSHPQFCASGHNHAPFISFFRNSFFMNFFRSIL